MRLKYQALIPFLSANPSLFVIPNDVVHPLNVWILSITNILTTNKPRKTLFITGPNLAFYASINSIRTSPYLANPKHATSKTNDRNNHPLSFIPG